MNHLMGGNRNILAMFASMRICTLSPVCIKFSSKLLYIFNFFFDTLYFLRVIGTPNLPILTVESSALLTCSSLQIAAENDDLNEKECQDYQN